MSAKKHALPRPTPPPPRVLRPVTLPEASIILDTEDDETLDHECATVPRRAPPPLPPASVAQAPAASAPPAVAQAPAASALPAVAQAPAVSLHFSFGGAPWSALPPIAPPVTRVPVANDVAPTREREERTERRVRVESPVDFLRERPTLAWLALGIALGVAGALVVRAAWASPEPGATYVIAPPPERHDVAAAPAPTPWIPTVAVEDLPRAR